MDIPPEIARAYQIAKQAWQLAYAPYSKFKVGCALKVMGDEETHFGCNVENVAAPSGTCAERAAIAALFGHRNPAEIRLQWLVIVTDSIHGDAPCGMCQQVIAEFADLDLPIYLGNLEQLIVRHTLGELRPLNHRYPHRHKQLANPR